MFGLFQNTNQHFKKRLLKLCKEGHCILGLFQGPRTDEQQITDEQIREHLLGLCKEGDYGICPPPMDANVALKELQDFFLGKDWENRFENKPTISDIVSDIVSEIKFKTNLKFCGTSLYLEDANEAISELCDFFLGKDWYVSMPLGHEQVITEIIFEIESQYKHLHAANI